MKKILVIEDEPEMRRNITTLLRYHDYEPIAAEKGRQGVETRGAATVRALELLNLTACSANR